MPEAITDNLDLWTSALLVKSTAGRGNNGKLEAYGVKKLRELILELAVRGKLVSQDASDEPASVLLKRIQAEKAKLIAEGKIKKDKPLPPISNDEIPFELPKGWLWTTLASISLVNPRNNAEDNSPASFVPMTMIGTKFNSLHDQEARLWKEIKQGFTHFAEGDIGVAKITPCFENSKACVFSGLLSGVGAGTTELHIVRPLNATLSPRFVLAYLKSPQFLLVGETRMTGTAGQKRLPKEFVESNPFPLPPLPEQHRIVAKVDELMALCDQLEQHQTHSLEAHQTLVEALLGTLTRVESQQEFSAAWARITSHFDTLFTTEASIDQLKQTILQLAVMGKLVPQDPNDEPVRMLLERVSEIKVGLVGEGKLKGQKVLTGNEQQTASSLFPSNWQLVCLGDLVSVMDAGWSPACQPEPSPNDAEWGVLKTTAVQVMQYLQEENKVLPHDKEPKPQYEVKAGDILITRAGPKNRVAISCLVEATRPRLMISDKIIRFHLVEVGIYERYISLCLNAGVTAEYLEASKSGMAESQMNISQDKLRLAPIPLCPINEQHRIVAKVDELMALCDALKARFADAQAIQLHLADAIVEQAVC